MEIEPINVEELKQQNTASKRKTRNTKSKKKKEEQVTDVMEVFVDTEEQEAERLRERLLMYANRDSSVVTEPINDNVERLVAEMDLHELKARCRKAQNMTGNKIDNVVGQQVIGVCNLAVGELLGCLEELEESTSRDELLKKSVTDYLSNNILMFVPEELKISGIYASHVLSSYGKASKKKPKKLPQKSPQPQLEAPQQKPQEEEIKPIEIKRRDEDVRVQMSEIKDKLIQFRSEMP